MSPRADQPVLVGFSGGVDSTVLLHAAATVYGPENLLAVHINHHLQPDADSWSRHCVDTAKQWAIRCVVLDADQPPERFPGGLENWARDERRRLFVDVAARFNTNTLALAHHADDQAETVLMNLARGAGPVGLAGMPIQLQRDGLTVCRPLLALTKSRLQQYAGHFDLPTVSDASNGDVAMTRNRIRHDLLPALDAGLPGFSGSLRRTADNARDVMQALQLLLFGTDGVPHALSRADLAQRDPVVARQMLQLWLRAHGLRSPRRERLNHLLTQMVQNASVYAEVRHDGHRVCRYRDHIELQPLAGDPGSLAATTVRWRGEDNLALPGFAGSLRIVPVAGDAPGIDAQWLAGASLRAVPLQTSARIKPAANRPTRRIKQLCQEAGIARWQRAALPMLWHGQSVVFAAPFGLDLGFGRVDTRAAGRVQLDWVADGRERQNG